MFERSSRGGECLNCLFNTLPPDRRVLSQVISPQTGVPTLPLSLEGTRTTGQALHLLETYAECIISHFLRLFECIIIIVNKNISVRLITAY